jgi:hypothetical protein
MGNLLVGGTNFYRVSLVVNAHVFSVKMVVDLVAVADY